MSVASSGSQPVICFRPKVVLSSKSNPDNDTDARNVQLGELDPFYRTGNLCCTKSSHSPFY